MRRLCHTTVKLSLHLSKSVTQSSTCQIHSLLIFDDLKEVQSVISRLFIFQIVQEWGAETHWYLHFYISFWILANAPCSCSMRKPLEVTMNCCQGSKRAPHTDLMELKNSPQHFVDCQCEDLYMGNLAAVNPLNHCPVFFFFFLMAQLMQFCDGPGLQAASRCNNF